MTSPWQYALTVGPLGVYLWVLASWQGGRHPHVVRGLTDFVLLAFGVGGVLVFGPFGQWLSRTFFRRPDLLDQVAILALFGLCTVFLARGARKRLVVYHVDADRLVATLDDILKQTGVRYTRTLEGFEDRSSSRGLQVEVTRWLRCAVVESYGHGSEALIREVRSPLRARLRAETTRPSWIAVGLYACSVLVTIVPLIGLFLTQPRAREALRVLLQRLQGG
jgi:hypothetical protein